MRVAVLGSTGQLGRDLVEMLAAIRENSSCVTEPSGCGLHRAESLRAALARTRPQALINCAAFVRVDDCEDQAPDAFEVNALGALNVARACAEIDATCVHVSTDYVFDGGKAAAYVESDVTFPINIYGVSKLAGELLVRQTAPRWLIFRVASLLAKPGRAARAAISSKRFCTKPGKMSRSGSSMIFAFRRPTRGTRRDLCELLQADITGIFIRPTPALAHGMNSRVRR